MAEQTTQDTSAPIFLADVRALLATSAEQEAGGLWSKFAETPEGYLKGRAVVTNVGVFPYRQADGSMQWQLRSPEEVFHPESLSSLRMQVLTNDHPSEAVSVANADRLQIGSLGDEVMTDALRVSVPIIITGKDAIADMKKGKRALSCGYTARLDKSPGVWMGVPYDVVQREIRYNHVALVTKGRAGDDAVIRMDGVDAQVANLEDLDAAPIVPKVTPVADLGCVDTKVMREKMIRFVDFNPNHGKGGLFAKSAGGGSSAPIAVGTPVKWSGEPASLKGQASWSVVEHSTKITKVATPDGITKWAPTSELTPYTKNSKGHWVEPTGNAPAAKPAPKKVEAPKEINQYKLQPSLLNPTPADRDAQFKRNASAVEADPHFMAVKKSAEGYDLTIVPIPRPQNNYGLELSVRQGGDELGTMGISGIVNSKSYRLGNDQLRAFQLVRNAFAWGEPIPAPTY